jgi:hypothetical protein
VVVEVVVWVVVVDVLVWVDVEVDVEVDVFVDVVKFVDVDNEQALKAKTNKSKLNSNRSFRMACLTFLWMPYHYTKTQSKREEMSSSPFVVVGRSAVDEVQCG